MKSVDICIIGGGPAGMTAAATASSQGLTVAILDERATAGGVIYRGLVDGFVKNNRSLAAEYSEGFQIIERLDAVPKQEFFGVNIWRVDMSDDGGGVSFSSGGKAYRLKFANLILATGAMERTVAFEGWTMPGVMTVGAAQLLLKASGIVPEGKIVLAGNGPLLSLFASQLIKLGVRISAVLDTAPKVNKAAVVLKHLRSLVKNREKLVKGLRMTSDVRSAKVPTFTNVAKLATTGSNRLTGVIFESDGKSKTIEADALLVHEGVFPNTHLSRALNCQHVWDASQHCLRPVLDPFGESSIRHVFIIGDGASIDGAKAAPASAEIAVCRILDQMGRADARVERLNARAVRTFSKERSFRGFLEELYPPRISTSPCSNSTIVCRCEEVTAGSLRAAVADGAIGPSQAKVFTRCGMGACQGRICGSIVSELIAQETGKSVLEIGSYNVRFPLKPISLAEMAMDTASDDHAG
jgi:NADPH-dependent 2,4-dienoyl-CoA reductase/sulfur reductase-like enzyme